MSCTFCVTCWTLSGVLHCLSETTCGNDEQTEAGRLVDVVVGHMMQFVLLLTVQTSQEAPPTRFFLSEVDGGDLHGDRNSDQGEGWPQQCVHHGGRSAKPTLERLLTFIHGHHRENCLFKQKQQRPCLQEKRANWLPLASHCKVKASGNDSNHVCLER